MRDIPSPMEIALKEAEGFRLVWMGDQPNWFKNCVYTVPGQPPRPIRLARITGTDGAHERPAYFSGGGQADCVTGDGNHRRIAGGRS